MLKVDIIWYFSFAVLIIRRVVNTVRVYIKVSIRSGKFRFVISYRFLRFAKINANLSLSIFIDKNHDLTIFSY